MFSKTLSATALLTFVVLLTACDRDLLSDKGKLKISDYPAANTRPADNSGQAHAIKVSTAAQGDVKELEWDDLIPPEWLPDSDLVFKYNNGEIDENDPRIVALRKKLQDLERLAPVNKKLNGKRVRLPGFVLPLEGDGKKVSEFLLLPYHGACIHVPAPPANQVVFVRSKDGTKVVRKMFDTVWVTGIMKIEKTKNVLAEAGYTLIAEKIETYE